MHAVDQVTEAVAVAALEPGEVVPLVGELLQLHLVRDPGAAGDLTDRLLRAPRFARGHVVDFLELPNWPVSNVADSVICTAAAHAAVLSALGVELGGGRGGGRSG